MKKETKEARLKNLLTPFSNILACHTLNKEIPEDLWASANESMIRILDILKEETMGTVEKTKFVSASPKRPKQRELLNKYFNKKQLEFVNAGFEMSHPQKYFVKDIKFVDVDGLPEDNKGCIVMYHNNAVSVGSNYAYRKKGNWYFNPVRNGAFAEATMLPREVFAYVILK